MAEVDKCLGYFDLKNGVFTYGVIFLILRIMSMFIFIGFPNPYSWFEVIVETGCLAAWFFSTAFALVVALGGIILKMPYLMYPNIALEIFELVLDFILFVVVAIMFPAYTPIVIVFSAIQLYGVICMQSLAKKIDKENRRVPNDMEANNVLVI